MEPHSVSEEHACSGQREGERAKASDYSLAMIEMTTSMDFHEDLNNELVFSIVRSVLVSPH